MSFFSFFEMSFRRSYLADGLIRRVGPVRNTWCVTIANFVVSQEQGRLKYQYFLSQAAFFHVDKFENPHCFFEGYRLFENIFDIWGYIAFHPSLSIFGHSVCEWETFGTSCLFTKQYFSFNLSQKLSPHTRLGAGLTLANKQSFSQPISISQHFCIQKLQTNRLQSWRNTNSILNYIFLVSWLYVRYKQTKKYLHHWFCASLFLKIGKISVYELK